MATAEGRADRRVLITGGSEGIGFGMAVRLAALGARVLITGRDRRRGQGAIVNAGTGASRDPAPGMAACIVSKRAVEAPSHAASREYAGRGIRIDMLPFVDGGMCTG